MLSHVFCAEGLVFSHCAGLKFFTDAVPWLLTEYILVDDTTQSIVLVKGYRKGAESARSKKDKRYEPRWINVIKLATFGTTVKQHLLASNWKLYVRKTLTLNDKAKESSSLLQI